MAERCRWAFMSWMEKKLARWPFLGAGNICGDKKLPSTLAPQKIATFQCFCKFIIFLLHSVHLYCALHYCAELPKMALSA